MLEIVRPEFVAIWRLAAPPTSRSPSLVNATTLGKVLLVGGSTRMPAVERQVRELLGKEPSHSLNPDECVAMGAAVQGALLQGGGKLAGATGAAAQGLVLMDVTPLTLSIETLCGVATPLITRNSMIPTRKSLIFTTARPMARWISFSERLVLPVMVMFCSRPVARSFADTFTTPFTSISKVTSIWGLDEKLARMPFS